MKTFNKKLKALMVAEIKNHQKQDQIIQGTYGQENGIWKGCAVGCSIHSLNLKLDKDYSTSDHSAYEKELGIPRIIACLEDRIFEGLSVEESKKWPLQFMQAVPVGVDLKLVWPEFAVWLLTDKKHGVIQYAKTGSQRSAIQKVADLYQRKVDSKPTTRAQFKADAADAAYAAYAADAAADAADAAADAKQKHYSIMAKKLLQITKATK